MRIKGYKYIEIAEELGTTTGNVKSCIHQARNNIRRMMQE
jgi:DNA-directed RNA polymerase specialized sigma24 family protein